MTPEEQRKREIIRALLASSSQDPMGVLESVARAAPPRSEDDPYAAWDSRMGNGMGQSFISMGEDNTYPVGPYQTPQGPLNDQQRQMLMGYEGSPDRAMLDQLYSGMTPAQVFDDPNNDKTADSAYARESRFRRDHPLAPARSPRPEPAPSGMRGSNPLEALSAPQAMEQALMGGESRAPATSPRPQPSPMRGMPAPNQADDVELQQTMWARMSPEQQAQVLEYVQQGAPIDQALDAVADADPRMQWNMNAISRGQ